MSALMHESEYAVRCIVVETRTAYPFVHKDGL